MFRIVAKAFARVLIVYVLVYTILSSGGQYQVCGAGIGEIYFYSWAPLGFYRTVHLIPNSESGKVKHFSRTGGWNGTMLYMFLPLWFIDTLYIHKNYLPLSENDRPLR